MSARTHTHSTHTQEYTYVGNKLLCFPPQYYPDVFAKINNNPSPLCSAEPNTLTSNLTAKANDVEMKLTSVARCPCSQSVKCVVCVCVCVGIHMNSDPVSRMLISLHSRDEVHAPLWRHARPWEARLPPLLGVGRASSSHVNYFMKHTGVSD